MNTDHALVFTFDGDAHSGLPPARELCAALQRVVASAGVDQVEVFAPHPEHARLELFGDGAPPFTIVECRAGAPAPLLRLVGDPGWRHALASAGAPERWRAGLFSVVSEPVPEPVPEPIPVHRANGAAPVALVVHYYGPTDDPAAFAAHYVAHHPATLAQLPRVREVLCYVPTGERLAGVRADPTVIRNEVRFDSMDDLLDSLRSPAMREVSADAKAFPRFGRSTHYPMERLAIG